MYLVAWLFAAHLYAVADIPPEWGVSIWYESEAEGVDPYDSAAILISEKSGPDLDFSLLTSLRRPYSFDWNPKAEGAGGERGLFQLIPFWARSHRKHRGSEIMASDLWSPLENITVGVYTVRRAHDSHETCQGRKYNRHDWPAHFKCGREERDTYRMEMPSGEIWETPCRSKQKKFEKLRASLVRLTSPDFQGIGRAHNRRVEAINKTAERDWKREQKRARRKAQRIAEMAGD